MVVYGVFKNKVSGKRLKCLFIREKPFPEAS